MNYSRPEAGGSWEHRSGDCPEHGGNIAFAKPYGSHEHYLCVACMLRAAEELERLEDVQSIVRSDT